MVLLKKTQKVTASLRISSELPQRCPILIFMINYHLHSSDTRRIKYPRNFSIGQWDFERAAKTTSVLRLRSVVFIIHIITCSVCGALNRISRNIRNCPTRLSCGFFNFNHPLMQAKLLNWLFGIWFLFIHLTVYSLWHGWLKQFLAYESVELENSISSSTSVK